MYHTLFLGINRHIKRWEISIPRSLKPKNQGQYNFQTLTEMWTEIWDLHPPGTCRACPGLYWDCFFLFFFFFSVSLFFMHYTRVIQELKIQNGWDGKGNCYCEGGSAVMSNSHFCLFLHSKKHLVYQKFHEDKEMKNTVTMWLCRQWSSMTLYWKLVGRLNKCLVKSGDYVEI